MSVCLSVCMSVCLYVCHTVIDDGAEGTIIPSSPQVLDRGFAKRPEGLVCKNFLSKFHFLCCFRLSFLVDSYSH